MRVSEIAMTAVSTFINITRRESVLWQPFESIAVTMYSEDDCGIKGMLSITPLFQKYSEPVPLPLNVISSPAQTKVSDAIAITSGSGFTVTILFLQSFALLI